MAGISLKSSSSPPASNNSTVTLSISDNRVARTLPAEPAPTITKSKVPASGIDFV